MTRASPNNAHSASGSERGFLYFGCERGAPVIRVVKPFMQTGTLRLWWFEWSLPIQGVRVISGRVYTFCRLQFHALGARARHGPGHAGGLDLLLLRAASRGRIRNPEVLVCFLWLLARRW